jgi:hypothetical protein
MLPKLRTIKVFICSLTQRELELTREAVLSPFFNPKTFRKEKIQGILDNYFKDVSEVDSELGFKFLLGSRYSSS